MNSLRPQFDPVVERSKKVLLALVLAFAVSTTSVSCVPYVAPYCINTGGPAVIC
ncbi:hypothetical protein QRB41_27640 [Mycobacterium avium subsp. hominissuis]|uniref:hypothetical protein n=1 Tax=Mycobacterium avium TaxID=1764 RepID=UPI0026667878|nr:hypothetical protein [Mycobacterium avium]MDO2387084.1 hypothetical protein [Mycobacterium avium subsp. hominissuis]